VDPGEHCGDLLALVPISELPRPCLQQTRLCLCRFDQRIQAA